MGSKISKRMPARCWGTKYRFYFRKWLRVKILCPLGISEMPHGWVECVWVGRLFMASYLRDTIGGRS